MTLRTKGHADRIAINFEDSRERSYGMCLKNEAAEIMYTISGPPFTPTLISSTNNLGKKNDVCDNHLFS